jgi:hypothetical protein
MLYTPAEMRPKVRKVNPKWEPYRQLWVRRVWWPLTRVVSRTRRTAVALGRQRTTWLVAIGGALAGLLAAGIVAGHWSAGRVIWYCIAALAAMLAILAQIPRRENVGVEVDTLGSIAFVVPERSIGSRVGCRVEADAAIVPVTQALPAEDSLLKLCIPYPSAPGGSAAGCRIAIAKRAWLGEGSQTAPFRLERAQSEGAVELGVTMQVFDCQGSTQPLLWRQSDDDAPMKEILHEDIAVGEAEKVELHVTRGPIVVLRLASVECGFVIQHDEIKTTSYFRLDTMFGKSLWSPPYWHEDLTETCLEEYWEETPLARITTSARSGLAWRTCPAQRFLYLGMRAVSRQPGESCIDAPRRLSQL